MTRNSLRLPLALALAIVFSCGALNTLADDDPAPSDPPASAADEDDENDEAGDESDEPEAAEEEDEQPRRQSGADLLKGSSKVRAAFREIVADASGATVAVNASGKAAALGAVVDAAGYVLTKASELKGGAELECKLPDGRIYEAEMVGLHKATDLALLKIDVGEELPVVRWSDSPPPLVGSWLASVGPGDDPVSIGVVSVAPRKIPPASGLLGVFLEDTDDGVRINQVMTGSAAEKAGVHVNDIITHHDDAEVRNREQLIGRISKLKAGTVVRLRIKRGDETIELVATLGSRDASPNNRGNIQNRMGGRLSGRRRDFESVLQHDSILSPDECGGVIVDLDGRAVGLNIARAGRVESYALPVSVIKPLLPKLIAGEFAPALVRLEDVKRNLDVMTQNEENLLDRLRELARLKKAAGDSQKKAATTAEAAKSAAEDAKQAAEAAEKVASDAAAALKAAEEKLEAAQKAADEAKERLTEIREEIEKLTEEKTRLEKEDDE